MFFKEPAGDNNSGVNMLVLSLMSGQHHAGWHGVKIRGWGF
ncbi:hypothetical protein PROVALCAL_01978 [Providencia alcalifaciens DSM 30120]|uniref:Uncharacterized protein n=1 Tax=Providencia alcalifaciens DSM 30120 TaxID=520999 RepID=B6XF46_9GAMM|nr:hypothetical protein PROVALCAL_01978 [Providencia alcalifaciens DSM 30120]